MRRILTFQFIGEFVQDVSYRLEFFTFFIIKLQGLFRSIICISWYNWFSWFIMSAALCDETKFLTDNETSYSRQIFLIPIPRLFYRDQIFQDRYRDFFSETKYFDIDRETFFRDQIFGYRLPIPRLLKNWQKSRDRDLNRDLSTSFEMKFGKFGTYKQNWNFRDQNLGL